MPPTFARMVLEISLKSMRKQLGGGDSNKSSEKQRVWQKIQLCHTFIALATPLHILFVRTFLLAIPASTLSYRFLSKNFEILKQL